MLERMFSAITNLMCTVTRKMWYLLLLRCKELSLPSLSLLVFLLRQVALQVDSFLHRYT